VTIQKCANALHCPGIKCIGHNYLRCPGLSAVSVVMLVKAYISLPLSLIPCLTSA